MKGDIEISTDGVDSGQHVLLVEVKGVLQLASAATILFKSALYDQYYGDTNVFLKDFSYLKATKLD